jgi:hypothetical protein
VVAKVGRPNEKSCTESRRVARDYTWHRDDQHSRSCLSCKSEGSLIDHTLYRHNLEAGVDVLPSEANAARSS